MTCGAYATMTNFVVSVCRAERRTPGNMLAYRPTGFFYGGLK